MNALVTAAFLMGLFGGAHCVAMCGGVSSLLCSGQPVRSARFALAYNAGRVASYTLLGLLVGSLGTMRLGLPMDVVRFGLRALAALCMLTVGLHLVGLPSFVKALESVGAPIWRRVAPLARRLLPLRSPWQALAAGGLWAFMPCGLLYGALALAASAESPALGAATMAAFAFGTVPVMLAVGAVAHRVVRAFARVWIRRAAGAVILVFGLWSTAGLANQVGMGAVARPHACCPRP
ncbi:MAG TPA: sulfite exporter TauE/SafE family protein [Labilithrix sp.]|nr:sulfite exporter TauE/SafE family protein [Labilithrix sp.]